ncbi:cupredoxin domain-containing protein [Actinomadura opuntiae]|uniref:cupredoxin domain-containing protein n=1 Tax=Actinomadura sp. OS1-43 TaxID=604315 RepID=UPI00255AF884|nr:cupredoxin family copper-binding protein [Actinomadura sp. OS1-43]MDL4818543.1 cupredoxin family copper-binding protein [Actinomadura sp. OS1-43]
MLGQDPKEYFGPCPSGRHRGQRRAPTRGRGSEPGGIGCMGVRSARAVITAVVCCATATVTGCGASSQSPVSKGSSGQDASSAIAITIKNFTFAPSSLTVGRGTKVTVVNNDSTAHTVTDTGKFDTGHIAPGKAATFTAPAEPGRYPYICAIHPFMQATLIVR